MDKDAVLIAPVICANSAITSSMWSELCLQQCLECSHICLICFRNASSVTKMFIYIGLYRVSSSNKCYYLLISDIIFVYLNRLNTMNNNRDKKSISPTAITFPFKQMFPFLVLQTGRSKLVAEFDNTFFTAAYKLFKITKQEYQHCICSKATMVVKQV